MKWQQLLPKIQYAALHNAAPKAIVVHVGSNDLAYQKGVVLIHNMKDDLSNLVQTFTSSAIFVSAMLPRIVWSGTQVPDKMESKRKFINRVIRRFIKYNGGGSLLIIQKLHLTHRAYINQMAYIYLILVLIF